MTRTFRPLPRRAMVALGCALLGLSLAAAEDMVALKLDLPAPTFVGTPKEAPAGTNIEKPSDRPRAPLMVPKDVTNLAAGKKFTCSDTHASAGQLEKLTDGKKDNSDENIVLLRKGRQYVQLDLGSPQEIFAIALWHAFDSPKVYREVIVQVADDAEFTKNVHTLFNNDLDNNAGLGAGTDRQYYETNEGKTIDTHGAKAQFVRLYSKGSTESALNEYTEVEVYGRPPK